MTPEAHMLERLEDGLTSDEYRRMAEATQFAIGLKSASGTLNTNGERQ